MPEHPTSPEDALRAIQTARVAAADAFSRHSWRYDLVYALLAASMVASEALPNGISLLGIGICVLCLGWLARAWAGQHGMWIRPLTPKKARWVAIGIAACIALLMLVSVAATRNGHADFALMLAPAGFVIALAGSRLWRHVHRREMTPVP
ncbi:hypothetical protein [Asticcacaulis sp. 201]|uniref:hypothetical protein n=1 Tax=Asticcacaulis sp. 201 TaxID=3028787 RepID=UPI00291655BD|nr:hypothetical protein [Asticcacaulis sp. 201]MDV6329892.1 hypothetical protein [Asticcacaulis sp. 201]